jgi:hypothetical protein
VYLAQDEHSGVCLILFILQYKCVDTSVCAEAVCVEENTVSDGAGGGQGSYEGSGGVSKV